METLANAIRQPDLDFSRCLQLMQAILAQRPAVARPFSISITTTKGEHMSIDSAASPIVSDHGRGDAELNIVTNETTLSALLTGTLDPKRPADDHLFVFGGDLQQWSALVDSVSAYNGIGVRMLRGAFQ